MEIEAVILVEVVVEGNVVVPCQCSPSGKGAQSVVGRTIPATTILASKLVDSSHLTVLESCNAVRAGIVHLEQSQAYLRVAPLVREVAGMNEDVSFW